MIIKEAAGHQKMEFRLSLYLTSQEQIAIWHWCRQNIFQSWGWVGSREIETLNEPNIKEQITFSFESQQDFILFSLTFSDNK